MPDKDNMCVHSHQYETCPYGCTFRKKEWLKAELDQLKKTTSYHEMLKMQADLTIRNKELNDLRETIQINCTPPDDCNDPIVLKGYMKACLEEALKGK